MIKIEKIEIMKPAFSEVIRNAVIHRDYSLSGKDIKVAVFDNRIEITSPGQLLPSIDYDDMESGQSDIRNKVLAPVLKNWWRVNRAVYNKSMLFFDCTMNKICA